MFAKTAQMFDKEPRALLYREIALRAPGEGGGVGLI